MGDVANVSPQTSISSLTPYCTAFQFLQCYSKPIVADMLRVTPSSPPPSYLAILDVRNPAGRKLYYHMKEGAGEIESFVAIAKRYTPEDLAALRGVSQVLLQKLNIARGMWSLSQFLKPMSARPEDVPFAKDSFELLKMLANGETIFTFQETLDAGLPSVIPARPYQLLTANIVGYANRLFPNYSPNGSINRPGYRGNGDGS